MYIIYFFGGNCLNLPTFWVKLDFLLAIFTIRLKYARGRADRRGWWSKLYKSSVHFCTVTEVGARVSRVSDRANVSRNKTRFGATFSLEGIMIWDLFFIYVFILQYRYSLFTKFFNLFYLLTNQTHNFHILSFVDMKTFRW